MRNRENKLSSNSQIVAIDLFGKNISENEMQAELLSQHLYKMEHIQLKATSIEKCWDEFQAKISLKTEVCHALDYHEI